MVGPRLNQAPSSTPRRRWVGEFSLDELLPAVAGRYMANPAPDEGPAEARLRPPARVRAHIIPPGLNRRLLEPGCLSEASLNSRRGKPMDAKAFRKAQKSSHDLQEGHSAGTRACM